MAGFLYYLPKTPMGIQADQEQLFGDEWFPELAHLRGRDWSVCGEVRGGPDGGSGIMLAVKSIDLQTARNGYYPDFQTWREVNVGKKPYWVGIQNGNPPTPRDLARRSMVEGAPVELADGNRWVIPSIHVSTTTLPKEFTVSPEGNVSLQVTPAYRDLMDEANIWHDRVETGKSFSLVEFFGYAVGLLNVNYHVGVHEVGMLNVIHTTPSIRNGVIEASLGVPQIIAEIEAQKKMADTQAVGSEVSPGDAA
ncbi:hypothetical protein Pan216_12770 [Planctomycetes bacterium Pan216]|uniref:Uncharacterized protein n=1 Tax=Kolteria novifilia TaxID=2527975 RepID=A0A518B0C9_9BACT|nr:hypothetical protein Pan216_12770 [Planctomycetes bacterium Pan216]